MAAASSSVSPSARCSGDESAEEGAEATAGSLVVAPTAPRRSARWATNRLARRSSDRAREAATPGVARAEQKARRGAQCTGVPRRTGSAGQLGRDEVLQVGIEGLGVEEHPLAHLEAAVPPERKGAELLVDAVEEAGGQVGLSRDRTSRGA